MIASKYRFHGHGSLKFLYKNGRVIRSRYFTVKYITNRYRSNPRFAVVVEFMSDYGSMFCRVLKMSI